MDQVVGWYLHVEAGVAAAEMSLDEDGNLVISVTNQGGEAWHVHL